MIYRRLNRYITIAVFIYFTVIVVQEDVASARTLDMENARFDGGLGIAVKIGSLRIGQYVAIDLEAFHKLHRKIYGAVESEWCIPSMITYVERTHDNGWIWSAPDGTLVSFGANHVQVNGNHSRYSIKESDPRTLEITMDGHLSWIYANGYLKEIRAIDGVDLVVATDGARITSMVALDRTGPVEVMNSAADARGRIRSINIIGGASSTIDYEGEEMRIARIISNGRLIASISYSDNLVAAVSTRSVDKTFKWRAISPETQERLLLPYPVYLSADEMYSYVHKVTRAGPMVERSYMGVCVGRWLWEVTERRIMSIDPVSARLSSYE